MTADPHADFGDLTQIRLPVLGVNVSFATNSSGIAAAIYDCYGAWAALAAMPHLLSDATATVRIIEHGGAAGRDTPVFRHRAVDRMTLLITGTDCVGVADAARRESYACVPAGIHAHPAAFRDGVLEPLTLFLLGTLDRQPLHGAAIARGGVGIVLAGASGAGKSTLAWAARTRNFTILADEPVYVQLEPVLRIWGRRARVHLQAAARAHFVELLAHNATKLPSGKTKIVVDDADGPRYADRVGLCVLQRTTHATPELVRISPVQAVSELTAQLDPGYDLFATTIGERIARIAERGAWKLYLTDSPYDALPLLEQVAAELERTP